VQPPAAERLARHLTGLDERVAAALSRAA
jgi:hypothetical protein